MMAGERDIRSPFSALIGAALEERKEGYARLSLAIGPQHTNPHGVMHGGVVTTLMDSSLGAALSSLRGDDARKRPHATIEMNTSFLSSARPGDEIVVEGRVVKLRRTVAFGEAEARRRSDNEIIARGRFTFAIQSNDS